MSLGPLFDTETDRVLEALPSGPREALRGLLRAKEPDDADLLLGVDRHLEDLETARTTNEFLDLDLAHRLAAQSRDLLAAFDTPGAYRARRSLVRAAVRYFILKEDAESDTTAILGLDDDAEVLATVARELGRPDLIHGKAGAQ